MYGYWVNKRRLQRASGAAQNAKPATPCRTKHKPKQRLIANGANINASDTISHLIIKLWKRAYGEPRLRSRVCGICVVLGERLRATPER